MARVIRTRWVYKPEHRYKLWPRETVDMPAIFEYEKHAATHDYFPERLDEAPKLWMSWVLRPNHYRLSRKVRDRIEDVFGEDWEAGKPKIFPNTAQHNDQLWRLKSYIEVKPVTFPDGEPTTADLPFVSVTPDGECAIERNVNTNVDERIEPHIPQRDELIMAKIEAATDLTDAKHYRMAMANALKHPRALSKSAMSSTTMRRYAKRLEVHEDPVYDDGNVSRL